MEVNMNKILTAVLCVMLCGILTACSSPVAAEVLKSDLDRIKSPQVSQVELDSLVTGNSQFAFDLYHVLSQN